MSYSGPYTQPTQLTRPRKPTEYAPIDETYNPTIHRMNQAIRARAVDPDAPIRPPAEILLRFSKPPEKLVEKAKTEIEALIDAAEIKKGMLPWLPALACQLTLETSPSQGPRPRRPQGARQAPLRSRH